MFWEFIIFSGNSIVDSGEAVEVMEIIPGSDDDKELGTKTAVFLLLLIFCSSLLAMGLVWKTFPDMDEQDQKSLKFPKTLDDAKELGAVLSRYKEQYFAQVLVNILQHISIKHFLIFTFPMIIISLSPRGARGREEVLMLDLLSHQSSISDWWLLKNYRIMSVIDQYFYFYSNLQLRT